MQKEYTARDSWKCSTRAAGHAAAFPRFAEAGACPEKIAPRRSAGWRWHGDGVRRPARCMFQISPDLVQSFGRLVGSRFMLPGYAWPGPSEVSAPIMLRPGFPFPGIPKVVSPPVHAAVRAMARLRPTW